MSRCDRSGGSWFAVTISILLLVTIARADPSFTSCGIREINRSGNSVLLEITVPAPRFDTINGILHLKPFAAQLYTGDPLAELGFSLRVSRHATVSVISHQDTAISAANLQVSSVIAQDVADNGRPTPIVHRTTAVGNIHHGIGYASLHYVGRMRAADISRLDIGFMDRGVGVLRYAKKIVVKITDPEGLAYSSVTNLHEPFEVSSSVFRSRVGSASGTKGSRIQSSNDVQRLPGIQSDDGKVYRMHIRTSGIYHITYDDVRNFGIDPSTVDPKTLRIINRGQQVAVYVFDHQDGHFDPNDYFEFYGEEKHYDGPGTIGDFYYDPDTKDNIYYLVWGSHYSPIPPDGVKRMVEESGEIRTANKSIYPRDSFYVDLKDSSFASTIHYEENNIHDNLEISDINQRSDLRDHDFMAILSTGQGYQSTYTAHTVVPFPDVRTNRPVSFRVALHGISHFDPGTTDAKGNPLPNVPNEDDALVSVNGHFVLHGTWDSQTPKFLSTDTASQRFAILPTAQLLGVNLADSSGGIAPITITFAQQRDTDVAGCRFGVNWIDIKYNRMYYAYQDQLTFRAPPTATTGLYQFTLQNFARTDISIYRKGVSKLSNIVITSNPNVPRSAKAIFQINISSASDEFIAVTDSTKLKPYKYSTDDFAGLTSPSNAGEYLIITNRDHLSKTHNGARVPLQDLADYRASHNHVSTKIVDVANIYDEFRYGARSANAIKAFLTYAYHNWQDPPKYAMLVGVTHEGTDDPQQYTPPDQVPAPYIQAYLEGDVAADEWYAMLDGDDFIPDITISRLATQDAGGDAIYLAKLQEFETDPVRPGAWKDRALFVGAGGSFDVDIDNLLTGPVPPWVSSLRQSTVAQSPYRGTDQTLIDTVNAGVGLLAYFGHGGTAVWDDLVDSTGRSILENSDISRFHNEGKYPVVFSLTCFTATYDGKYVGILNTLQNQPVAGSIACMGTTSFGWELNDRKLVEAIIPHYYDSVAGSIADKIIAGKVDYLSRTLMGDLIPPTLVLCYHTLGDPMLAPNVPTDKASMTLSNRVIQPAGTVTINGTTSIGQGSATLELVDNKRSPLVPPHVMTTPVSNGVFSFTDNVPNTQISSGSYRVVVSSNASNKFAATDEDVTISDTRVTELDFEPRPLPVGLNIDFSAAVQSPQPITSVIANFNIYSTAANGSVTMRTVSQSMAITGGKDRYHTQLSGAGLIAGDKIVATITITAGSTTITSDSTSIIVGAASDPSIAKDAGHHTLTGKLVSSKNGLAWSEPIYNWGMSPVNSVTASLLDVRSASSKILGSTVVSGVPAHGSVMVSIPVSPTSLDSSTLVFAVSPDAGNSALNLRDSLLSNDSTIAIDYPLAAAAYQKGIGTTLDGQIPAAIHFSNDEAILSLSPTAESNISADVIRLDRRYAPIATIQPDIHFLPLYTNTGKLYSSLRVVSDSLGAIPLVDSASTLTFRIDSLLARYPANSLFVYRMDDRSKLWNKLSSSVVGKSLTAKLTSLGTFAIAYNTDTRDPMVDITVEGQVFSNNGEVPPQPHIHAVLQDANGIDITPGKTIMKIDNRILSPSEYVILDSGRTATTINLRAEPSLSPGTHTITVQTTDDNGRSNNPPKELDVHVSNGFSVGVLGSYPNPFTKDYMFIAYEIRGVAFAESVALDIYTVSGRRIRTMSFPSADPTQTFGFLKGGTGSPTSLGYHEVWWDGRDDGGDEVANGVYFYRLTVKANNSVQEIKGKFARVR